MGDYPARSANSSAGGPVVTARHSRAAGGGVSPTPPDDQPLGGGGALPTKSRFSMETGFRTLSTAAAAMVLVIIVAIAIFLVSKAVPALRANTENFFTYQAWFPNDDQPKFGIAALAFGTVLSSIIALIVAVP
ncbi:MAG: phosphate transport system permease protein, partial [Actinoplanes sp.]|nr:phosphate transport system permease protein [Actinoplanes sp.]